MIEPYRLNRNNKDIVFVSNFEIYNQIEILRSEVKSLQKSVANLQCEQYKINQVITDILNRNKGGFPL